MTWKVGLLWWWSVQSPAWFIRGIYRDLGAKLLLLPYLTYEVTLVLHQALDMEVIILVWRLGKGAYTCEVKMAYITVLHIWLLWGKRAYTGKKMAYIFEKIVNDMKS